MRTRCSFVALALSGAAVVACSVSEDTATVPAGHVEVGALDTTLATAGCAESSGVRHASGLNHDEAGTTVIVEAQILPAPPADEPDNTFRHDGEREVGVVRDGSATATVRSVVDGEVIERYVGDGLVSVADGATYTLTGDFVSFDGAAQAGDVTGSIEVTCPPSADPGGGTMAVDGREVRFDLVFCLQTPVGYEARARSTVDVDQALTLRRSRSEQGWFDQIDATGEVVANERVPVDDEATAPRSVTAGAFEVRGARVTAEGEVLGPERHTSITLTCGIDLVARSG